MLNLTTSQYSNSTHFLVHISDTHLIAGDDKLYGSTVSGDDTLQELLVELEASKNKPDAIIITGDIADQGDPEAYRKVLQIINPVAERMGTEVIWVMGNHDDRSNFREVLLEESPSYETIDRVYDINGLRLIVLDTSVKGFHHGEITLTQLEWLKDVLSTSSEHGSILAMHHPPIPSMLQLSKTTELRDQKALAEVIKGSDIRSIIAGHLHYSSNSTFAGIPVSVATSSCYTQDLNVESGGTRGRDGAQGLNLVHVYEEVILHSVVPIGKYPTVGTFVSAEETKTILELLHIA
jgi:Icc protein